MGSGKQSEVRKQLELFGGRSLQHERTRKMQRKGAIPAEVMVSVAGFPSPC